jgi:hypothetical protein
VLRFEVSEIEITNATITITDAIFQDKLAEISKQNEKAPPAAAPVLPGQPLPGDKPALTETYDGNKGGANGVSQRKSPGALVTPEDKEQELILQNAEIAYGIRDGVMRKTQKEKDREEEIREAYRPKPGALMARGGTVYANNGMFVPRGTDTVPAMLTPGEFVVNRASVQRGNNLQMLKAMNSGGGASGPGNMSGGGSVRYYKNGGKENRRGSQGGSVGSVGNSFSEALPELRKIFSDFSSTVDRLAKTNFSVKLDTTNVNVNLNGGSFLESMKESIKTELLAAVAVEIGKYKPNSLGDMVPSPILGKYA